KQEISVVDYDQETMKQVSSIIIREKRKPVVIIINKEGFVLCISNIKEKGANEILHELIRKYGGSGGGNRNFAFGKLAKLPGKK
ncbi:MAG: hypothetical protein PHU63_03400, partial [Candidatus ainarchaeum sp.]|nr:hypothetical protein [Candidatus ainarchaeum sp.]